MPEVIRLVTFHFVKMNSKFPTSNYRGPVIVPSERHCNIFLSFANVYFMTEILEFPSVIVDFYR